MPVGKKIIVVGSCGSGKSTFSGRLHGITGIPLYHLDNIKWKADKTRISREEFVPKLEKLLQKEEWIIDGDYSLTYEMRIRACNTVFFLDYDEETCMSGITERVGKKRPDIPWMDDELDPVLVERIRSYRKDKRPVLYKLFEKYPGKQVIVFQSRGQAEEWLEKNTEIDY